MRAATPLGTATLLLVALAALLALPACNAIDAGAIGDALGYFDTGERGDDTAASDSDTGLAPSASAEAGDGGAATDTADGDIGTDLADTGDEPETTDAADGDTQSGLLTAGSFDDNLNYETFTGFIDDALSLAVDLLPDFALGQRVIVQVRDAAGDPVGDARVVVAPISQTQPAPAVLDQTTGSDGRVVFLTGIDGGSAATSFELSITPPGGGQAAVETRDLTALEWDVTLTGVTATLPTKLDLAFVVDATGSMADELEYLKNEMDGIAQAVSDLFPAVAQRFALIVYRDVGDIYVTRTFDFDALTTFRTNLEAQNAGGGGDWPEAVHEALTEAAGLTWQTADTARVLFWIADAPPHGEHAQDAFDAILDLRSQSIGVYPVASSGVDTELEFYMRAAAQLTLSEYLFLTDDSGVGNPHAEPHIPCYHVQRLDQLIIRMIEAELSGERVEPDAAEIIRTVGHPVNGVCQDTPDGQQDDGQQQGQ